MNRIVHHLPRLLVFALVVSFVAHLGYVSGFVSGLEHASRFVQEASE